MKQTEIIYFVGKALTRPAVSGKKDFCLLWSSVYQKEYAKKFPGHLEMSDGLY